MNIVRDIVKRGFITKKRKKILMEYYNQRYLFILILPALALLFIFAYIPMYGVLLAFKDYAPEPGMLLGKGDWVGLKYFKMIFQLPEVGEVVRNTLMYSILGLLIGFPSPIILAILFSELSNHRFKKIIQSISYLPNFLSWVVVAGLIMAILSPSVGLYGVICNALGLHKQVLLTKTVPFIIIILVSSIWKGVGWGSVIYLAVISGIDTQLYDAALVDGASRFQRIRHVTIPGLVPIIALNLIFSFGGLFSSNFEQMFNLMNPLVLDIADVIDTYIYRIGLEQFSYSYSTALGLVRTLITVSLLAAINQVVKKFSEYSIW